MINVEIFLFSFLLFVLIFLIHIFYWRIFKPKKQLNALIFIFIALPTIISGSLAVYYVKLIYIENILMSMVLYFAIAGAYIQTYPAIQAWSPSLYLIYKIGRKKDGLTFNEIKNMVNPEQLIQERVIDLVNEGFITLIDKDKSVLLTKKGVILAGIFVIYRKIIGLNEGSG